MEWETRRDDTGESVEVEWVTAERDPGFIVYEIEVKE